MRKYFSAALSAWVLVYFFSLLALTGVASAQEAPIGAGTRPPDFVEEMVRNTSTSNISNISENQTTEKKYGEEGDENNSWFQRNISESGLMVQFRKGGFIMYLILGCSVGGVYIFLERLYSLQKRRMLPPKFLGKILAELPEGDIDMMEERKIVKDLVGICTERDIPIARSLRTGLMVHTEGIAGIKAAIATNNDREGLLLSKGVPILGLLSNIAPLLGLLGTVTGMIKAFDMLAAAGAGKPEVVAAGIGEALVTTAGGLFVGIPLLLLTNIVQGKIDNTLMDMEDFALEVIERLIYRETE